MKESWGAAILSVSLFLLAVFIKTSLTDLLVALLIFGYVITFVAGVHLLKAK